LRGRTFLLYRAFIDYDHKQLIGVCLLIGVCKSECDQRLLRMIALTQI